jgi:hypothetical protein
MTHEAERSRGHGAFGIITMKPKVTVEVTVDVAKCLRALALILFVVLI